MPKASIGNYKGVMLCNRPNEFGQQRRAETGPLPFNSRVLNDLNPIGWNPCAKLFPRSKKKGNGYNNVLNRHKAYLAELANKKQLEDQEQQLMQQSEKERFEKFRANAEKQRHKVYEMKQNQDELFTTEQQLEAAL